jgi:hypothetical protein
VDPSLKKTGMRRQRQTELQQGLYDPSAVQILPKPTARVLRDELIAFRNLQANAIASGAGGSFDITEFDQVRDFAKQYGATLRYTAEVATEIGLR